MSPRASRDWRDVWRDLLEALGRAARPRSLVVSALVLLAALGLATLSLASPDPFATSTGTPFRFTAVGDYGANANTTSVLNGIAASAPAFHLALGDFSYSQVVPESTWCDFVK